MSSLSKCTNVWLLCRMTDYDSTVIRGNRQLGHITRTNLEETRLFRMGQNQQVRGMTHMYADTKTLVSYEEVETTGFYYRHSIDPENPVEVLVRLTDFEIESLKRDQIKSDNIRNRVVEKVFGSQKFCSAYSRVESLTVLYIETEALRGRKEPLSADELLNYSRQITKALGKSNELRPPQLFKDLLVFRGSYFNIVGHDYIVIDVNPSLVDDDRLAISNSALEFLEIASVNLELSNLCKNFESHEQLSVGYVSEKLNLKQSLFGGSASQRNSYSFLSSKSSLVQKYFQDVYQEYLYDCEFYDQRFCVSLSLNDRVNNVNQLLDDNRIQCGNVSAWLTKNVSERQISFGVMEYLENDIHHDASKLEVQIRDFERKNKNVGDYLHNCLNIEVANTNLLLQDTMYKIARLAFLISILALLLQILGRDRLLIYISNFLQ